MENFIYDDRFCSDISDLMDAIGIEEEDLSELEDDWSVTVQETTLEKIFVIEKEFAVDAIVSQTEIWEERFPEEADSVFKQIKKAVNDAVDIDKLNEGLPSLYYPNGKKFTITKMDLIEWCS
jgi:hypothetical protein